VEFEPTVWITVQRLSSPLTGRVEPNFPSAKQKIQVYGKRTTPPVQAKKPQRFIRPSPLCYNLGKWDSYAMVPCSLVPCSFVFQSHPRGSGWDPHGSQASCFQARRLWSSIIMSNWETLQHIPHRRVIPASTARRCDLPLVQLTCKLRQRQTLPLQLRNDRL
jgi:hypothetical protein